MTMRTCCCCTALLTSTVKISAAADASILSLGLSTALADAKGSYTHAALNVARGAVSGTMKMGRSEGEDK